MGRTFPARFGSFEYEFFSCDSYYLYTYVSVEDQNSTPLKSGLRGLFFEDIESGDIEGWVLDGNTWTFKTVYIPDDEFIPSNAPDLSNIKGTDDW